MKLLATIYALLLTGVILAQTTSIPDANFEQALINLGYDSGPVDGSVPTANISGVNVLLINNKNISDLTGIQDFTSLTELYCSQNNLTQVVLTNQPNLIKFNCASNVIDSININNCGLLQQFWCNDNALNYLDITQNPNLNFINFSQNNLTGIDVSQNTLLTKLFGNQNSLNSIDVSTLSVIDQLDLTLNNLSNIDLSQNTIVTYVSVSSNPLGSIDITQNTALQTFNASYCGFSTLNTTQNSQLTQMIISWNSISTIDLSQNTAMEYLQLDNNNFTSVDVSILPNLIEYHCGGNPLTSLNVTQNSNLLTLYADVITTLNTIDLSQNPLLDMLVTTNSSYTSFDLSANPQLTAFYAYGNNLFDVDLSIQQNLSYLDVRNNQLQCLSFYDPSTFVPTVFKTTGNPDLHCINTIDPATAAATFTAIDPWTSFATNCLCFTGDNIITGDVQVDNNIDCIGEGPIPNTILWTDAGYYALSDANGQYTIYAGAGPVEVGELYNFSPLFIQQTCPTSPGTYNLNFPGTGSGQSGVDFRNEVEPCASLTASVTSLSRQKCFPSITYVNYCNEGFADTNNVTVFVDLPADVSLLSASMPYTTTSEGFFAFDIGTLQAGDCGTIEIVDSVSCVTAELGSTACTRAWITPENSCVYDFLNTATWDNSNLEITGQCYNDTNLLFVIKNTGTGNMSAYSDFRLYEDGCLIFLDSLQIISGDSITITGISVASEYRLEVDQTPGYPTISNTNLVIESCLSGQAPSTYVSTRPNEDGDTDLGTDCMVYTGSFDPNDKQYFPAGYGTDFVIAPNTDMDYMIRFQNTGTDTAHTVVILDTLSPLLDLSTFHLLGSSDPVEIDIIGANPSVMKFAFYDIELPDSSTNQLGSQGFVRFALSPVSGLSLGTEIHNEADIYFDYNSPITTNDAWYTIDIAFPYDSSFVVDNHSGLNELSNNGFVTVYPNPVRDILNVRSNNSAEIYQVDLFDLTGKQINIQKISSEKYDVSDLKQGVYLLLIRTDSGDYPVRFIKE